jgi:hypothetical protein
MHSLFHLLGQAHVLSPQIRVETHALLQHLQSLAPSKSLLLQPVEEIPVAVAVAVAVEAVVHQNKPLCISRLLIQAILQQNSQRVHVLKFIPAL